MKLPVIRRALTVAQQKVNADIAEFAAGGRAAAGLASEGYSGGYRDALSDVQLVLNGVRPNRRGWWNNIEGLLE
jgi:hypothetical protein